MAALLVSAEKGWIVAAQPGVLLKGGEPEGVFFHGESVPGCQAVSRTLRPVPRTGGAGTPGLAESKSGGRTAAQRYR